MRRQVTFFVAVAVGLLCLGWYVPGAVEAAEDLNLKRLSAERLRGDGGELSIEDGTDAATIQRQLSRVIGILLKAGNRLDAIQAGWQTPGAPDQPTISALLVTITATAQQAIDVAAALNATMPR